MKTITLGMLIILLTGCATPKYVTLSADKLGKTKKYITFVDFPSGERFEFIYPGAHISTFYNFVCGWTEERRFRKIPIGDIDAAWTTVRIEPVLLDTSSIVTRLRLRDGEQLRFDEKGASFYRKEACVTGTALNGEFVALPVRRIEQGETIRNFEAVQASNSIKTLFAIIGVLGLITLRVAAELQQQ